MLSLFHKQLLVPFLKLKLRKTESRHVLESAGRPVIRRSTSCNFPRPDLIKPLAECPLEKMTKPEDELKEALSRQDFNSLGIS